MGVRRHLGKLSIELLNWTFRISLVNNACAEISRIALKATLEIGHSSLKTLKHGARLFNVTLFKPGSPIAPVLGYSRLGVKKAPELDWVLCFFWVGSTYQATEYYP